jgi:hypothetical protein
MIQRQRPAKSSVEVILPAAAIWGAVSTHSRAAGAVKIPGRALLVAVRHARAQVGLLVCFGLHNGLHNETAEQTAYRPQRLEVSK